MITVSTGLPRAGRRARRSRRTRSDGGSTPAARSRRSARCRRLQLVDRVRDLHVQQAAPSCASRCRWSPRRKTAGPLRRVVAADALEYASAVVEAVARRRGSGHPPSRRARRSSRSSRSPAPLALLCRPLELEFYPCATRSTVRAPASRRARPAASPAMWRVEPAPIQTTSCPEQRRVHQRPGDGALGNGATAPGSKPVACTTSSARATAHAPAPERGGDRVASRRGGRRGRARARRRRRRRTRASSRSAQLAADRRGGIARRRRARPRTPRDAPRRRRREETPLHARRARARPRSRRGETMKVRRRSRVEERVDELGRRGRVDRERHQRLASLAVP